MAILSQTPWPDDSMAAYFVVDVVGNTLVDRANGQVLSCNPNVPPAPGTNWQHRPAGAAGAYEQMTVNGAVVVYNPMGKKPVSFYFWPNGAPNV